MSTITVRIFDRSNQAVGEFVHSNDPHLWYVTSDIISTICESRRCCSTTLEGTVTALRTGIGETETLVTSREFAVSLGCCEAFCAGISAGSLEALKTAVKRAARDVFKEIQSQARGDPGTYGTFSAPFDKKKVRIGTPEDSRISPDSSLWDHEDIETHSQQLSENLESPRESFLPHEDM